jgi:hypothetical protein
MSAMRNEDALLQMVIGACRSLPPAEGDYLIDDFVSNLLLTVTDFQMHTTAVVRAYEYFKENSWNELRTFDDVQALLSRYPDTREGNTALAQHIWGYKLWTRAAMLRGLVAYFGEIGVVDQQGLKAWAERATFKKDFEGKVRGLGYAVFNWLVMRQGIETVKPDVHVRRFVEAATGETGLADAEVVSLVAEAARHLGLKAYELDWAIWEASRNSGALVGVLQAFERAAEPVAARSNLQRSDAPSQTVKCFGVVWDWKDDTPVDLIEARIGSLLASGAREIGLKVIEGGDTNQLLVTDRRDLPRAVVEGLWQEWWSTRLRRALRTQVRVRARMTFWSGRYSDGHRPCEQVTPRSRR